MKVYKYRGGMDDTVERDLASLYNNYFWASTAQQLNDPTEAYVNPNYMKDCLRILSLFSDTDEINSAFESVLSLRNQVGIYSMSQTPLDELMWAYYASSHTGFCIEYDLKRLTLEARIAWNVLEVKYVTSPLTIQFTDIVNREQENQILSKMAGTKSIRWAHEKEIRIITDISGKNYYAEQAVVGIYFGSRCTENFIAKIRKQLNGRQISYYKIGFSLDSYTMKATPIKYDKSIDGMPKQHLAPLGECCVPEIHYISEDCKQFYSYLEKAVEIVRRDPSCDQVRHTDFSGSKIINGKPVIYVTYDTNVPMQFTKCLNRDFSIDEIEEHYRI